MKNESASKKHPRRNSLKVWKRKLITGMALGLLLLLSSCGKEEGNRLGIDGYVFIPRKIGGVLGEEEDTAPPPNIWEKNNTPSSFKTSGAYLYYMQYSPDENISAIKRLPLGDEFNFSKGETVVAARNLRAYTVDREQNFYYFKQQTRTNPDYSFSYEGGILYKISPEGEIIYDINLEENAAGFNLTDSLAVDREGNLFFLAMGKILRIDREGNITGEIITDENHDQTISSGNGYLLESSEGNIYYVEHVNFGYKVWECTGDNSPNLEEISALGGSEVVRLYKGRNGILITDKQEVLYEYQKGQEAPEALLRWQESGIIGEEIAEVVPVSDNKILALSNGRLHSKIELLVLEKTPVEELPRKEELVLASLSPELSLRQAVINFNRTSDKYFVRIESYGENRFQGSGGIPEGAAVRLDSAVSSASECPDLLDLTGLDVYKYAGKGALEDLSPYFDGSRFRREDFLENALEGYTIGGKLVCIPKFFSFYTIAGRAEHAGGRTQWTAQDFTRTVDSLPGSIGVIQYAKAMDGEALLKYFFPYYYLEEFIDWDKGECRFDSQEFCALAEWILEHNDTGNETAGGFLPENVLFKTERIYDFTDCFMLEVLYQGKVAFVGYPCTEGFPLHKAETEDCVGILSRSDNKEGAWDFLEYYLTVEGESYYGDSFPTRMDLLQSLAEDAVTPISIADGEVVPYEEGKGTMKLRGSFFIEGMEIPYYFIPQEQVDMIMDAIKNVDFRPLSEQETAIINIVAEEMAYYLDGTKTVEEVSRIIQSRADMVVKTGQ